MKAAEEAAPGSATLALLPATGERYLSTPLFGGIEEVMDAGEVAPMKSTPGFQMP